MANATTSTPDSTEIMTLPEADPLMVAGQTALANWMQPDRFAQVQRVARVFSESSLVPEHYRGKMADCLIAVQMAIRMNIDPMMFFQASYVVHGRPGLEAKLMIALVNERGPFIGPIRWRFEGTANSPEWSCTAYAKHKADGELCEATVTWAMVKAEGWEGKTGSKWKSMPEHMFRYRSASFLIRQYCPEVVMGMLSVDELQDIIDVTPATATPEEKATAADPLVNIKIFEIELKGSGFVLSEAREIAEAKYGKELKLLRVSEAVEIVAQLEAERSNANEPAQASVSAGVPGERNAAD